MAKTSAKYIAHKKRVPTAKVAQVPWSKHQYFWQYLIFSFSFLLFFNSIFNEYGLDDELVTRNHRLTSKGISAIPEIFSSPYYEDAAGYSFEYRPVVLASFAIEHSIFGESPHINHFWNVILYSLSCVVLFQLLKALFREYSVYLAAGVTLLFAAHTAHTEVVCNIKCRDEIFALLFSLLTFQCALNGIVKSWKWLLFIPFLFTLALMSKASVLAFILLIPILLILLQPVRFWHILTITLLLQIPAFFFLTNVGGLIQKMEISFALFAANIIFFATVNYRQIIDFYKNWFQNILQNEKQLDKTDYQTNIRTFFQGSLPDKSFFRFSIMFPALLLLGLYLSGIYTGYKFLSITVLATMTLLFFFTNERYGFWLLATIFVAIGSYNILISNIVGITFFYVLCSFAFIYGKKSHRLIWVLAGCMYLWQEDYWWSIIDYLLLSVFYYIASSRYYLVIFAIAFSVLCFNLYDYQSAYNADFPWEIVFFSLCLVLIRYKKDKRWAIYPMLATVVGITILSLADNSLIHHHKIQREQLVAKIAEQNSSEFIPTGTNRILGFAEQCIQPDDPWQVRAGTSLTILWHYLGKVIIPYPLAYYYGYQFIEPTNISDLLPIISLVVHLLLGILALLIHKREKLLAAGLLTYLIAIAICSNYFAPIPGMVGDRFLLVPSLGWVLTIMYLIHKIFKINLLNPTLSLAQIPKPAKYVFASVLLFYSTLSVSRNAKWHDTYTLYNHDISYVNNSAQAHNLLAMSCLQKSDEVRILSERTQLLEQGVKHLKKAIEIYPEFFNPTYDLGRAYTIMGQADSAKYYYDKTIALNDSFTDAHYAVGEILRELGRYDEAKPYFEKAIYYVPNEYVYYDKLSFMYFLQKQYDKAIEINRQAMVVLPNDPRPYYTLARIFFTQQNRDSSIVYLNKVFDLDPANALGLQLKAEMQLP